MSRREGNDTIPCWKSFEVALPDTRGLFSEKSPRPVSEEMAGTGDRLETAINKMKLLQLHGWPAAKRALLIDRADDESPDIWILKCKPSCWRLYFHVYEEQERILYVLAKCKKTTPRKARDSVRARNVFNRVQARSAAIVEFEFPPD